MNTKATVLLVLAALLGAAGCGDSAQDQAMADVCAARDNITKQVDQLKALTPGTATTEKVSKGLQAIRDDLRKIGDARDQLSDDRRKEVQAANDEFAGAVRQTLKDVGTSVSAQEASSQLKPAFAQLESSYKNSFGKIDCS
jgi:Tfp pilus assembly protein PilP